MNEERHSGVMLRGEVREGHVVGVTSEQELNETKDRAAKLRERGAFQSRKRLLKGLAVLVVDHRSQNG